TSARDLDRDVEVLRAVTDHEERFLDLQTDELGLDELERAVVEAHATHSLTHRGASDRRLALSGGKHDHGGLQTRAPKSFVISASVTGGRRVGRALASSSVSVGCPAYSVGTPMKTSSRRKATLPRVWRWGSMPRTVRRKIRSGYRGKCGPLRTEPRARASV